MGSNRKGIVVTEKISELIPLDAEAVTTALENTEAAEAVSVMPGVYDALARLPEQALLDESALARAFGVNGRTIRRMVSRQELPPPLRRAGRALWFAGRVLDWLGEEADLLAKDADKLRKKIWNYST